MITDYPRQRDLSILEYYMLFLDFLQLRAYITDINLTLDDESELDIFINRCKYSDYLNRITYEERRQSSQRYKYVGRQLVETLDKFLLAPGSPARASAHRPSPLPASTTPTKFVKPFPKFNKLTVNSIDTMPFDSDDSIEISLNSIRVPDDSTSKHTFHTYCAAVHQLTAEPSYASDPTCIVCGERHKFDKCPILHNTDFLRSHYIRYCQFLKRDSALQQKQKTTNVHFLDTITDDNNSALNDAVDQDFRNGCA